MLDGFVAVAVVRVVGVFVLVFDHVMGVEVLVASAPRKRSQFRARKVQRALTRHQMVGSMGQVGSAGDNAAMESFFALLQRNVLDRQSWATRDELRIEIVTWIERTFPLGRTRHHNRASHVTSGWSPTRLGGAPNGAPPSITLTHSLTPTHAASWLWFDRRSARRRVR